MGYRDIIGDLLAPPAGSCLTDAERTKLANVPENTNTALAGKAPTGHGHADLLPKPTGGAVGDVLTKDESGNYTPVTPLASGGMTDAERERLLPELAVAFESNNKMVRSKVQGSLSPETIVATHCDVIVNDKLVNEAPGALDMFLTWDKQLQTYTGSFEPYCISGYDGNPAKHLNVYINLPQEISGDFTYEVRGANKNSFGSLFDGKYNYFFGNETTNLRCQWWRDSVSEFYFFGEKWRAIDQPAGNPDWHWVKIARKNSVLKMFIDGVAVFTANNSTAVIPAGKMSLGSGLTMIDEIIFKTACDNLDDYTPPTNPFTNNLSLVWEGITVAEVATMLPPAPWTELPYAAAVIVPSGNVQHKMTLTGDCVLTPPVLKENQSVALKVTGSGQNLTIGSGTATVLNGKKLIVWRHDGGEVFRTEQEVL